MAFLRLPTNMSDSPTARAERLSARPADMKPSAVLHQRLKAETEKLKHSAEAEKLKHSTESEILKHSAESEKRKPSTVLEERLSAGSAEMEPSAVLEERVYTGPEELRPTAELEEERPSFLEIIPLELLNNIFKV